MVIASLWVGLVSHFEFSNHDAERLEVALTDHRDATTYQHRGADLADALSGFVRRDRSPAIRTPR
jgi:hypothetical protein